MTNNLIAILLSGLMLSSCSRSPQVASQIALNNTVKIVIKLENKQGKHGEGLCSGVIIGPNLVITAGHCVDESKYRILNVWVRDIDGISQPAFILKREKHTDLAILGIIVPERHWTSISKHLAVGDQVIAVGHPLGNLWSVTFGHVSALGRLFDELKGSYIQFDAPINGGNSGGGLFNLKGELVGIITMHETPDYFFGSWSGLSFAIDMKTIQEFLK